MDVLQSLIVKHVDGTDSKHCVLMYLTDHVFHAARSLTTRLSQGFKSKVLYECLRTRMMVQKL